MVLFLISPQLKYDNLAKCPSCFEQAGENFKGSGNKQTTFNWFKCGRRKLL